MKTIVFLKNYSKYKVGDKAEFKASKADKLIICKVAEPFEEQIEEQPKRGRKPNKQ